VTSVYLTAVVLREEGLLAKGRVWATDADGARVEAASHEPLDCDIEAFERDYATSGGSSRVEEYCKLADGDGGVVFRPSLRRPLVFFAFDPEQGSTFNEFQLVFASRSQDLLRGSSVIHDSLCPFGLLVLTNPTESAHFSDPRYERLAIREPVFRKLSQ
jgi:hypothetical protein